MNGAPASLIVYSGFRKLLASCFLLSGWSIVVSSYLLFPSQVWLLFWCGHYSYLSCMCLKENPDFFTFSSFLSSGSISWNLAHFSSILAIQSWQYFFSCYYAVPFLHCFCPWVIFDYFCSPLFITVHYICPYDITSFLGGLVSRETLKQMSIILY